MDRVLCSEILGRDIFKNYSEVVFMMALAKVYRKFNCILDCSMMSGIEYLGDMANLAYAWGSYDKNILVKEGTEVVNEPMDLDYYEFDCDALFENDEFLFKDLDDCYYWEVDWYSKRPFKSHSLMMYSLSKIDKILLHIVAYQLVCMWNGKKSTKLIKLKFSGVYSKSFNNYINLFNLSRSLNWFSSMIKLEVDLEDANVDIDFIIHAHNGIMHGHYQPWGIKDKFEQLKRGGYVNGTICLLFERKGLAETNKYGRIIDSKLIRIDKIEKRAVHYTILPLYRTKEEVEQDYFDTDFEERHKFEDVMNFKLPTMRGRIDLCDLAIDDYLYDELSFITKIEYSEDVTKLVTIDGSRVTLTMNAIDAVYWLLSQYNIEFNSKLFKDTYPLLNGYKWDELGSHGVVYGDFGI